MPSAVFLGAVATSSCGIGLQITFSHGIGAMPWIANLTALAPYKPLLVAGTAAFLEYHFYLGLLEAQRGLSRRRSLRAASPRRRREV